MWQLTLLSALMLSSNCHAIQRQSLADLTPEERAIREENHLSTDELIQLLNDIDDQTELLKTLTCGRRNWFNTSLDDSHAYPHEAPWLVNIKLQAGKDRCDGSLIHPQVVLTAAHCVAGKHDELIEVFAGQSNPHRDSDSTQRSEVKEIIIHENFEPLNRQKNFAILILREAFVLNEKVGVVCLLGIRPKFFKPDVITGGWITGDEANLPKSTLNLINDDEKCRVKLDESGLEYIPLEKHTQCAEPEPRPTECEETFGVHLAEALSPNAGHYYLIGVLSWNPYCQSSKGPSLWSLLQENDKAWIEEELQSRGIQF